MWYGDVACQHCGEGNNGFRGSNVPTTTETITLLRDELLYDVKNIVYVVGDVMKAGDAHDAHQVQDAGEEGNVDRITRVFDLAHGELTELLYRWTKEAVEETAMDDTFGEEESYVIALSVPRTASQTTVRHLKNLCHEYMVCRAVADWFTITYKEKAAIWGAKAADVAEQIKRSMERRTGRLKRPIKPF